LRGEPFRIWFFTISLWKFMIYDAGRFQICPNARIRDPFACGPGSVGVVGSSGIGGCCFVNTQYEFQFPAAWTLRIGLKNASAIFCLPAIRNELKCVQNMKCHKWHMCRVPWESVECSASEGSKEVHVLKMCLPKIKNGKSRGLWVIPKLNWIKKIVGFNGKLLNGSLHKC